MKPHVVIGGGIGGLVAAWSLQRRHPGAPVVVLEQAPTLGGLLGGTHYPDAGLYFDQGTHIFQETGDAEIDRFIRDAIPPAALVSLAGDIAGAVFNGRLQANSHFPDLRRAPEWRQARDDVQRHAAGKPFSAELDRAEPLAAAASRRFGPEYGARVTEMLGGMFQIDPDELAAFALLLPGLTRVIAVDAPEWEKLAPAPEFRAIVGYPEQRNLPAAFRHGRRSFYTRHGGSCGVIHALAASLARAGVALRPNTTIRTLAELDAASVVVATGVIGAARLLGVEMNDLGLTPPLLHRVVHVVLERPVDSDVQYFHGLDPANAFYRVTHYRAFSGDATDRRLSIEVLERADLADDRLPSLVLEQLHALGFLPSPRHTFARVERVPKGFPRPTTANLAGLARLWQRVRERLPAHVSVGGAGTGDGLFFTNEILVDLHRRIQSTPAAR